MALLVHMRRLAGEGAQFIVAAHAQITASDMGVKLYDAFGFVHNGNFMQYQL